MTPNAFNPLDYPILFQTPLRLRECYWAGHIPFGMWLVSVLKPAVLVELGTHWGGSYCGFCHAVQEHGLSTRLYAVDTWEGEVHAGLYGPEVLADLRAHHDPRYGQFSELLQTTFDQAATRFADGSVDLLHIDGLHTYEAVRHDFETWRSKVSDRGIVLFHDVAVRDRPTFGVCRFWDELCAKGGAGGRHFDFRHSFGLGVLALGTGYPEPIEAILNAGPAQAEQIREFFARLGHPLELRREAEAGTGDSQALDNVSLRSQANTQYNEALRLRAQRDRAQAEVETLQSEVTRLQADGIRLQSSLYTQLQQAQALLAQAVASEAELRGYYAQLRFRVADRVNRTMKRIPLLQPATKALVKLPKRFVQTVRGQRRSLPDLHVPVNGNGQPPRGMPPELASPGASDESRYLAWTRQIIATRGVRPQNGVPQVDVVVPVYKGVGETLACLESALASTGKTPSELIVIDDCSPEPILKTCLAALAGAGLITLVENPENLGFVGSVNRGLALHEDRDVILLNSDTEVASDWLDRLRRAAYARPKIATVTPFSNNATLCSYPSVPHANVLPADASAHRIDQICRYVNAGEAVEIPTGVGFCMYVRRECIKQIGVFDAQRFGKGYGEETDFCLRATAQGWKHLHAADVFVYHAGGVSFGPGKSVGEQRAYKTLCELHPQYPVLIERYMVADPARPLRRRIDLARAAAGRPTMLFITHHLGGGTERHVQDLAGRLEDEGIPVLILHRHGVSTFSLQRRAIGWTPNLVFEVPTEHELLLEVFRQLEVRHVHVHHDIGVPPEIMGLAWNLGVSFDWTIHDYYSICPRVNLVGGNGFYCGEPDVEACNRCVRQHGSHAGEGVEVGKWREHYGAVLAQARRVFVPHIDVAQRLARYFPKANFVERRHPEPQRPARPVAAAYDPNGPLRVALLGTLVEHKGAAILIACAKDALARKLPLEFVVVGHPEAQPELYALPNVTITGRYREEQVFDVLEAVKVHGAFFASVWPETFSFTLSIAREAHLYPVALDFGAIAARIKEWGWGEVLPVAADARAINDRLLAIARTGKLAEKPPEVQPVAYASMIADYYGLPTEVWTPGEVQAALTVAT